MAVATTNIIRQHLLEMVRSKGNSHSHILVLSCRRSMLRPHTAGVEEVRQMWKSKALEKRVRVCAAGVHACLFLACLIH